MSEERTLESTELFLRHLDSEIIIERLISETPYHRLLAPRVFPDKSKFLRHLEERMELAQRASSMVLALRRKVGIKVRQPLSKLIIPVIDNTVRDQLEKVKALLLGEVNVKDAEFIPDTAGLITKKIKPNFKTLGKKYGKQMKEIAAAFAGMSQEVISAVQAGGEAGYVLNLPSGDVRIEAGDYEISSEDMPGWLVASDGPLTLALDVTITDALKREGTARELINRIQNLRKDSGFDVTDRVNVTVYTAGDNYAELHDSLSDFKDYVLAQTLAVDIVLKEDATGSAGTEVEWGAAPVYVDVKKI